MKNFVKPDLSPYFAGLPVIGIWMRFEYENVNNYTQCVNVMHNWFNIAEDKECKNIVKKQCYLSGARLIYNLLTGKTFESKLII